MTEHTERGGEGHGGQATSLHEEGPARNRSTGRQMPRSRISPYHSTCEYTLPEHLERLRSRGLGPNVRSPAWNLLLRRIFGAFIRHEPLRRVHECVFGPRAEMNVDPRL